MLKGEVMADVVVESFRMDDRPVMLGLPEWMCWPDVSMGAGERPRRGEASCWSAMLSCSESWDSSMMVSSVFDVCCLSEVNKVLQM
jgi:hypothetical protein